VSSGDKFQEWIGDLRGRAGTRWGATLLLLGGWLLETIDTLVILRLLGAPLGFGNVLAFEAGLALVRSLAFFAPAGFGIQDIGYISFLNALALPGGAALGAAFVLMKRSKELFFIALGGLIFLVLRSVERRTTVATEALS
jgi:hypothetical protein